MTACQKRRNRRSESSGRTDMTGELFIVTGEPGVGKSLVAETIADEYNNSVIYRTDEIRKELFEEPDYSSDESQITYDEMFYRARSGLKADKCVILDATFSLEEGRLRAEHIAEQTGAAFTIVRVHCNDQQEIRRRLRERDGISDADLSIYRSIKESFEPIFRDRVDIFNHRGKDYARGQVIRMLA